MGLKKQKQALFFTVDAILAATVILASILAVTSFYLNEQPTTNLNYMSSDFVNVLSTLRVSEIQSTYVQGLISEGNITRTNNTIIEQIGEFWAEGEYDTARDFTKNVTEGLAPDYFGYSIWIGDYVIYQRNKTNDQSIIASRKIVSGIEKEKPREGYISKVFLSGIDSRFTSSFAYFGGYVGEGNITQKLILPDNFTQISQVYLELDAGTDFKLYINGNYSGSYIKEDGNGSYMRPDRWYMNSSHFSNFKPGINNLSIRFEYISENATGGGPNYIAGGYIRASYSTSDLQELGVQYHNNTATKRIWLPGIDGSINLYSSFYVPGYLNSTEIYLHYYSNYTTFLRLGNTTVYSFISNETVNYTLLDEEISTKMNLNGVTYSDLSLNTIPLRMGLVNITRPSLPTEIVLVTDVSGSMEWCTQQPGTCCSSCGWPPGCSCGTPGSRCGYDSGARHWRSTCVNDEKRIDATKNASHLFIDTILENTGPKIGLVSYETSTSDTYALSNDTDALKTEVNAYDADGGTCICCGVNSAVDMLAAEGDSINVVPRQASGWKYRASRYYSPPADWTELDFDETGWSTGTAPFGRGYYEWLQGFGYNTQLTNYKGYYYFRKKFNINDTSALQNALLHIASDDGTKVYINGHLVFNNINSRIYAKYWNNPNINIDTDEFQDGENVVAVQLRNRRNTRSSCSYYCNYFTLELAVSVAGEVEQKYKTIVLMTDGQANYECSRQGTTGDLNEDGYADRAEDDAIQAACDAFEDHGIVIYAVGFSEDADSNTLGKIANCSSGQYYKSSDMNELIETYDSIASQIVAYTETQVLNASGIVPSILFNDSYIEFNYTPLVDPPQYAKIPITVESPGFGNNISNTSLFVPSYAELVDLVATSYSAERWTDNLTVDNQGVFRLKDFDENYHYVGDPYIIQIPTNTITQDVNNSILVTTGTTTSNETIGSMDNKLIYTLRINNFVDYGGVFSKAEGCIWDVYFEDGDNLTLTIPPTYNGTEVCYYTNASYDINDSIDNAVYNLFSVLDFDNNGKPSIKMSESNFEIDSVSQSNVPSLWGPTIVEARVW